MDESNLSSEALRKEAGNSREGVQGAEGGESEEFNETGYEDDGVAGGAEGEFDDNKQRSQLDDLPPIEAESVTLNSAQFPENYLSSDFATSAQLLSEVGVDYDVLQQLELAEFKDQVEVSQLQTPLSVATESAQTHLLNQLQSSVCPTLSSELSPTSVTESISPASPAFSDQKPSPATNTNNTVLPEVEQQSPLKPNPISSVRLVKTPSADGFNWRKYGQKQVKIPPGSRSYYKCTHFSCHAKKIERNDHLNNVIEIIPKGEHNHDPPPPRTNSTKESGLALSSPPHIHQEGELKESDPPREAPALSERQQLVSSGSDEIVEADVKEEHDDKPEPKRLKKSSSACPGARVKSRKKQKIVVRAAGDVGISGDGYRWRKYGQKMVKGNLHPRNYYRCTSAGCPVRKHLERALDNTNVVIITYKGVHDHGMPVPKKGQCQPSAPLVAAAAPASMNSKQINTKDAAAVDDHNMPEAAQWSVDTEGELTGDDAMEPTRTLVSIGFEIKQC